MDELKILYGVESIDDLKNSKDELIDTLLNVLNDKLDKLQSFMNMPQKDYIKDFVEIRNYMEVYKNEIRFEFERLHGLPGAREYMQIFVQEMSDRVAPIRVKIDELITKLGHNIQ